MKTCKTCKHWIQPSPTKLSIRGAWGSCKKIDEEGMIDVDVTCQCNVVESVTFETHPDFGCVSWGSLK